jgi:UvrB/uvrC motif
LPRLRDRLSHLAEDLRYEEAARLRDRIEALEHVVERLSRLRRLRALQACLVAPAGEPGWRTGFFVAGGLVRAVRTLPPGAGALLELEAGLACCAAEEDDEPLSAEQAEELLLIGGFVRRPPPELAVLPLERERIAAHLLHP